VSSNVVLEAVLGRAQEEQLTHKKIAVLLTHPHSKLGGDMNNNVTSYLFEAMHSMQQFNSVIKFNFRGVGCSHGCSSWTGKEERKDVQAVCDFLLKQVAPPESVVIVGYSYGSCVACGLVNEIDAIAGYVAISYPYSWMCSFLFSSHYPKANTSKPKCFITGSNDGFCNFSSFKKWYGKLDDPKDLVIVPGVDHFWFHHEEKALQQVLQWLKAKSFY